MAEIRIKVFPSSPGHLPNPCECGVRQELILKKALTVDVEAPAARRVSK